MINLPLQIGLSMYLLWRQVQWSFLAGLAAILLLLSCNYCVARATQKHMKEVMELRDVRMKAITELLSSIKIIKLSGQELRFRDRILSIRKKELSLVWKVLWLTAVNIFLLWLAPTLVSVSVFGCYAYVAGRQLTATTVFTSVALFRLLQVRLEHKDIHTYLRTYKRVYTQTYIHTYIHTY
jgi:ATP-binding cassette subfamily C (CFTR/MRP) protein 10